MNLRELTEKRTKAHDAFEQVVKEVERAGGTQSDEQRAQMDRHEGEFKTLDEQIARQVTLNDMERRMQGQPIGGTGDDRLDTELRNYSLKCAIASQVPDLAPHVDCGREREVSKEIAHRSGRPFQGMAVPMAVFEKRHTAVHIQLAQR